MLDALRNAALHAKNTDSKGAWGGDSPPYVMSPDEDTGAEGPVGRPARGRPEANQGRPVAP
eukprot:10557385-Alexandrium_andersonii.AAC.1